MNYRILISIIILSISLIIFGIIITEKDDEINIKLSPNEEEYLKKLTVSFSDIAEARTNERIFLEKAEKLREINISQIQTPHYLKQYKNNIFMISGASRLIHRISLSQPNARFKFGKGVGKDPGEIIAYSGCVFYKNRLYILCDGKMTIEVFSINGDFIKSIQLTTGEINKLQFVKYNKFMGIARNNRIKYYYIYNFKGELINKIGGPLINKKVVSYLYHENNIYQLSDSSYLQVPTRLGIFGYYEDDSLIYVQETVSGIRDPKIQVSYLGDDRYMESANFTNNYFPCRSITGNNKLLIFQAVKIENKINKSIFDVYDKNSLEYKYSFRLDGNEKGRVRHPTLIENNVLITNQVSKLAFWKIPIKK